MLEEVEVSTDHPRYEYVAVSYPWKPSEGEDESKGGYYLKSSSRPVKLRDILLDRIIHYVQYATHNRAGADKHIPFWIDQLSINQKHRREKYHAVQSMDLVYKYCTAAVGYLWVEIETQDQLDLLGRLLRGQIANESQQRPRLGKNVDGPTSEKVLQLLLRITDDPWWNSAWIFQEDYVSEEKMCLLIRHSAKLSKENAKREVGDLLGELVVNSADFRKHATLFCLAYRQRMAQDLRICKDCDGVLNKAGEYTIMHKYDRGAVGDRIRKAMSPTLFTALGSRRVEHTPDIPAISANCLQYPIRLYPSKIKMSRSSLSICILALYLINGEIIKNDEDNPGQLSQDIFRYLQDQTMSLDTRVDGWELRFMKHCRLSSVRLSDDGIVTKGMLWKVCKEIPPDELLPTGSPVNKDYSRKDLYQVGLDEYQRKRLGVLARWLRRLRYICLAEGLENFLRSEQPSYSSHDDWPSGFCMSMMAHQIVKAMDAGKPLQLGLLIRNNPKAYGSYQAIFVRNYREFHDPRKSFIFTSWSCTREYASEEFLTRNPAKYVSLEVVRGGQTSDGCQTLRTKRWVNGLCFFAGEQIRDFVFPWPQSLIK
ncbi:hypothetical protein K432DRAFT_308464 [Lepidopterella palustris CBS 459.81]|uniref:Heterokaryon incompatibility domain-containing protein n=1 Tax=Lepidopterella palustris CBS 459.81 TaxID=1314670 RepID=A0A8E2E198_9PEZI|nr:hypothetical protein K432DRAFT_308464 [Lepidopterella palustris CBS 459.81]